MDMSIDLISLFHTIFINHITLCAYNCKFTIKNKNFNKVIKRNVKFGWQSSYTWKD